MDFLFMLIVYYHNSTTPSHTIPSIFLLCFLRALGGAPHVAAAVDAIVPARSALGERDLRQAWGALHQAQRVLAPAQARGNHGGLQGYAQVSSGFRIQARHHR